jgi:hypothetical protein
MSGFAAGSHNVYEWLRPAGSPDTYPDASARANTHTNAYPDANPRTHASADASTIHQGL